MRREPDVSVVIPVYNTEAYLRRCLDAVCGQTLREVEIVCVDDASRDASPEILREYAARDKRIRLLTLPENQGPSAARNAGLEMATGRYVGFVDSDDYPEPDFFTLLLRAADSADADIAKGCYRDSETHHVDTELNQKVLEDRTNLCFEFCSCLFRRALLVAHGIRFPEHLRDMEDPNFTFAAALHSNRVVVENGAFINIYHHETSSTGGRPDFTRVQHKCLGLQGILELANTATMTPESYGYVTAKWCLITILNASRCRELRARQYLADTVWQFLGGLRHRDAFTSAADVLAEGAGGFIAQCKRVDLPFFTEDICVWHATKRELALRSENHALREENHALREENHALREENHALYAERAYVTTQLEAIAHRNRDLSLHIARLRIQARGHGHV